MDLEKVVPRLRSSSGLSSLAEWIGDEGLLVMLHDEVELPSNESAGTTAQFVSCFALVDRDPRTVREHVRNFSRYETMIDEIRSVDVRDNSSAGTEVEFELAIDTPILSPSFNYTLEYRRNEQGDLLFEDVGGDFEHVIGRWEFLEINGKTLMIYTVWNDFSNLGLTFRTIFWAQPDFKVAMPMTQATVLTEQLRSGLKAEDETPSDLDELPAEPDVPRLVNRDLPRKGLVNLAGRGTLMYVHPLRWIRDGDRPLDLRFVSGIGLMQAPLEETRDYSTRFERYPEFVNQVSNVDSEETPEGFEATWTLDLGIKIISLSFSYSLEYRWEDETTLLYRRTGGDLQHVYGALEWDPVDEDRTLFFYTPAIQIGQDDSMLVQMADALPNRQIVIGVSAGALSVRNQSEWIQAQAEA